MLAAGMGGAAATAVDMSTLVLMVRHGTPIPAAAFVAAGAGAVVGFTINKHIAFRDPRKVTVQQLGRFGVVAVLTALLMAAAMEVVAVKLGVPYVIAKVICSVVVFAAWTYPAQRRLVFPARSLATDLDPARSLS